MADVLISSSVAGGSLARFKRLIVFTSSTVGYVFYPTGNTIVYKKTTNGGASWGSEVTVKSTSSVHLAFDCWYDQWTPGDSGTKIHLWYFEATNDKVYYNYLDTASDTLGTEVTAFTGVTAVAGRGVFVSGTKSRSGYLFVAYDLDAGAERGLHRSTDGGANWSASIAATFIEATLDECFLFPATGTGDNNDAYSIYQDASANAVTVKEWDNGTGTGVETATIQSMIEVATDGTGQIGFQGAVRVSDGMLYIVSFNEYDSGALTGDLQVWTFTGQVSGASLIGVTAKTDVFSDTDDTYHPAICILSNGDICVAYNGKADGSETIALSTKIYYKKSTDGGTTWLSETLYTDAAANAFLQVWAPLSGARFYPVFRLGNSSYGNNANSVVATSGTTYPSSVAGTLAFDSGAITRQDNKALAGVLSFVGASAKFFSRALAGVLSFASGALAASKVSLLSIAGTLSFTSGNLTKRSLLRTFTAALTFTGAHARLPLKALTATLTLAGATTRRTIRGLAGTLTFTSTLSGISVFIRALAGTLSFTGTTTKGALKAFAGTLNLTSLQNHQITRGVAATLSFVGTSTKRTVKNFTGTLALAGSGVGAGRYARTIAAALSFTSSVKLATSRIMTGVLSMSGSAIKTTYRAISGVLNVGSGTLTTIRAIVFTISGTLSFTGSTTKRSIKQFLAALGLSGDSAKQTRISISASLALTGSLNILKAIFRTFTGSLSFAGGTTPKALKSLVGSLNFAGQMSRTVTRTVTATLSFVGDLFKEAIIAGIDYFQDVAGSLTFSGVTSQRANKFLTGTLNLAGTINRRVTRQLTAVLTFLGVLTVTRSIQQLVTGTLSFVGSASKQTNKTAVAVLAVLGDMTRRPGKLLTGSLSFAGNAGKTIFQIVQGSLSFIGNAAKTIQITVVGALSFLGEFFGENLGHLGTDLFMVITGDLGFNAVTTKTILRRITATLSFIGKSIFVKFPVYIRIIYSTLVGLIFPQTRLVSLSVTTPAFSSIEGHVNVNLTIQGDF